MVNIYQQLSSVIYYFHNKDSDDTNKIIFTMHDENDKCI